MPDEREAQSILPNGDYFVFRTELRSGRVMLMYLPDGLTLDEANEVVQELRHTIETVRDCSGGVPTVTDETVN